MATTVGSIMTQANAIALSALGSPWKVLRYTSSLEKNDERDAYKAYGVMPAESETQVSVVREDMQKHFFLFVLSDNVPRFDSDTPLSTVLSDLYDKMDQIFKQFVNLKMNLAGTVVQVDARSMEAPIIVQNSVFIRMRFWVKYRQAL